MSAFLFAMLAVFLTSIGGRDQLLIARLASRLGSNWALLVVASMVAVGTAAAMALAGQYIAALLPANGKNMLVAIALLLAAVELAWPIKPRPMKEPTRSLFPIALVLISRQIGDGARFLVFAIAAGWATPLLAGAGGALGAIASVAMGWMMAENLERKLPLRMLRLALAFVIAVIAITTGLKARGLIA
ncbi:MAG: hypothetical protein WAT93_14005 [Pontixanthobacter sp.]